MEDDFARHFHGQHVFRVCMVQCFFSLWSMDGFLVKHTLFLLIMVTKKVRELQCDTSFPDHLLHVVHMLSMLILPVSPWPPTMHEFCPLLKHSAFDAS
jgi:hypothetical protein